MTRIVIDIPDDNFKRIRELAEVNGISNNLMGYSLLAIAHGTVLPKGHGDLIDRDELKISYETSLKQALRNNDRGIDLSKAADIPCERFNQFIDKEPAVIPTDKGE